MIGQLNKRFNSETFDKLIEEYNRAVCDNAGLVIYFCCEGGSTHIGEAIAHLINSRHDLTTVIAYGQISSSAFDLFFSLGCRKEILPGTVGMYHQAQMDIEHNESGRAVYHEGTAKLNHLKGYHKSVTEALMRRLRMTPKEVATIRKGDDCWFSAQRMQEFLSIDMEDRHVSYQFEQYGPTLTDALVENITRSMVPGSAKKSPEGLRVEQHSSPCEPDVLSYFPDPERYNCGNNTNTENNTNEHKQ